MWTRRRFLTRGAASLFGTGTCLALAADDPPREAAPDGSAAKGMITPETDQAIEGGLA